MRLARSLAPLCALALLALAPQLARAQEDGDFWEVNGIRLEASQVDRLASELAARTVNAVQTGVADLALSEPQRSSMQEIYRSVALDVYRKIADVLKDESLAEPARDEQIRTLALEGQQRSHERLVPVLDARQMTLYATWETRQVEAFKSKRWDRRRNRRAHR